MRSQASPWYNTQYAPSQYEGDINSFISYGDNVNDWVGPAAGGRRPAAGGGGQRNPGFRI